MEIYSKTGSLDFEKIIKSPTKVNPPSQSIKKKALQSQESVESSKD